jgi:hypothetical protein
MRARAIKTIVISKCIKDLHNQVSVWHLKEQQLERPSIFKRWLHHLELQRGLPPTPLREQKIFGRIEHSFHPGAKESPNYQG